MIAAMHLSERVVQGGVERAARDEGRQLGDGLGEAQFGFEGGGTNPGGIAAALEKAEELVRAV